MGEMTARCRACWVLIDPEPDGRAPEHDDLNRGFDVRCEGSGLPVTAVES